MEQMKKAGTFQFIENWKFETVEKATGKILSTEEYCNLIVNTGLTRAALLLNGNSAVYFRALAVGTGTSNPADVTQTALATEVYRSAATLTNGTYTAVFEHTFTFGEDNAITEAGIFDSATVSGSTMLARTVFTAKNVSTVIDLVVTATITIARA
jgi:hypothetical protein